MEKSNISMNHDNSQGLKDTWLSRTFGLTEPFCDSDGLYNGKIAPPDQTELLKLMSWWGMATGIFGIWNGWKYSGLAVCIGSIFAQNYWATGTFGWQRILDMIWIQILIWMHLYLAWSTDAFLVYLGIQLLGVGFYLISWHYVQERYAWAATITHALVHACANISLMYLYLH